MDARSSRQPRHQRWLKWTWQGIRSPDPREAQTLDLRVPGAVGKRTDVLKARRPFRRRGRRDIVLVAPPTGRSSTTSSRPQVSPATHSLTIEDSSSLRIMAQVSEIGVARVREDGGAPLVRRDAGEEPKIGIVGGGTVQQVHERRHSVCRSSRRGDAPSGDDGEHHLHRHQGGRHRRAGGRRFPTRTVTTSC